MQHKFLLVQTAIASIIFHSLANFSQYIWLTTLSAAVTRSSSSSRGSSRGRGLAKGVRRWRGRTPTEQRSPVVSRRVDSVDDDEDLDNEAPMKLCCCCD